HIIHRVISPPQTTTLYPYTTLFRSDHEPVEHVRAAREVRVAERSQQVLREHPEVADQTLRENNLDPSERNNLDNKLEEVKTRKRSEEHTSELQSRENLVCRLLLEKK